ncbi:hypothetical protein EN828_09670 [Mesorhizobium sp. M2D.F.Ca.ET.185.01.1.1]|nr:hypothetical protein EN783_10450 [Mesorhizobium sp. M2D.F.Ca.ET.140.01.1.1]TGP18728.1 hypothetical protein EN876_10460 [Mesorhizobium sp. M2D.F.Ca.ET.233.01.1.1]TGP35996.1 hypothetical protein EN875_009670 [Mesorhizobium sp. M2D.F.Ca.ET.232.01.1.1]TGP61497.1 hypothetical protein EN869_009930 [Mesorhizobium sp. M2D.F.Ca.ET.226.01.1.1]TGP70777.1 hypothetical protein EN868_06260 [Mesorhizobium sp. M2D.F.Ca.ET.225.01.1.1]TGP78752.1 hypothetical protein EN867_10410 [Mesorhizobium sp. M2D.F.Ca.ET
MSPNSFHASRRCCACGPATISAVTRTTRSCGASSAACRYRRSMTRPRSTSGCATSRSRWTFCTRPLDRRHQLLPRRARLRVLERLVIPRLFESRKPDETIRVWVPGYATGEEAYSIASS